MKVARTARRLRWEQLAYRPLRRMQARFGARVAGPRGGLRIAPTHLAKEVRAWLTGTPTNTVTRAAAVTAGDFTFLNHTERLERIDWQHRYLSHLWSYNLHYFDYGFDLALAHAQTGDACYARGFEQLALGWIEGTAGGRSDGWEPYAVSLRIVNWIYARLLFGEALTAEASDSIDRSIWQQTEFLSRRLEFHILANHLQKNLKALVIAGLYFDDRHARRWLERGERLLWRELFEQVLPDGGHYERSPMYHAIALGDFLEVLALFAAAGRSVQGSVRERVAAMSRAMNVLARPDGTLHLFNDAAHGIAPEAAWLEMLAERTGLQPAAPNSGVLCLPDTGYYGWASARGDRIVIDCGELGPRYQPGHAHCDLLSFELDLAGRPFIVDSGVHGYDGDPFREYVRSTRAHNTVMIGDRDQAEMWGTFRVARRPRVGPARISGDEHRCEFQGEYSPYYDRRARHHRRISRGEQGWDVVDHVDGATSARLVSFLHLHPDVEAVADGMSVQLRAADVMVHVDVFGCDALRLRRGETDPVQGWYCPEFGASRPATVIEMIVEHNDGREFGYRIRQAETKS